MICTILIQTFDTKYEYIIVVNRIYIYEKRCGRYNKMCSNSSDHNIEQQFKNDEHNAFVYILFISFSNWKCWRKNNQCQGFHAILILT